MDTDNIKIRNEESGKMISVRMVVEYCKKWNNMGVAKDVMLMLYRVLQRAGGTEKDFAMVDEIEDSVMKNILQLTCRNTYNGPVGQVIGFAEKVDNSNKLLEERYGQQE